MTKFRAENNFDYTNNDEVLSSKTAWWIETILGFVSVFTWFFTIAVLGLTWYGWN